MTFILSLFVFLSLLLYSASGGSCFVIAPFPKYSTTSMVRTSLGPWKFVRGMDSSSH